VNPSLFRIFFTCQSPARRAGPLSEWGCRKPAPALDNARRRMADGRAGQQAKYHLL